jgi:hypothetical protein
MDLRVDGLMTSQGTRTGNLHYVGQAWKRPQMKAHCYTYLLLWKFNLTIICWTLYMLSVVLGMEI